MPALAFWITLFGDPLNYDALRDMLVDLDEYAGVDEVQAHRFRHAYACAHYERNRDLIALQHALGHEDPKTTMNYLRGLGFSFHEQAKFTSPDEWLIE